MYKSKKALKKGYWIDSGYTTVSFTSWSELFTTNFLKKHVIPLYYKMTWIDI